MNGWSQLLIRGAVSHPVVVGASTDSLAEADDGLKYKPMYHADGKQTVPLPLAAAGAAQPQAEDGPDP